MKTATLKALDSYASSYVVLSISMLCFLYVFIKWNKVVSKI